MNKKSINGKFGVWLANLEIDAIRRSLKWYDNCSVHFKDDSKINKVDYLSIKEFQFLGELSSVQNENFTDVLYGNYYNDVSFEGSVFDAIMN